MSEKWINARKLLNDANRSINPCNVCDVTGTLIGKNIFKLGINILKINE